MAVPRRSPRGLSTRSVPGPESHAPGRAPSTQDISSGRRGGRRSGTSRPKGRTRDQLYDDARGLGIEGRSRMNKPQLERVVERAT